MKKFFGIAGLILLAASCSSDKSSNVLENEAGYAPVTVSVSDFLVSQEAGSGVRTRSKTMAEATWLRWLTLAFYKTDGTQVFKQTQERDNAETYATSFGEFSTMLPAGSYNMVVIANAGDNAVSLSSYTDATYGENRVLDTFLKTQSVTVSINDGLTVHPTLERVIAALAVQSTDARPANVTQMRMTYSAGGKGFNPSSGLATNNTGFENLVGFSGAVGSTTYSGGYLFLATDEQTMDVMIETLDADNQVIYTKTVNNVPFKRNRATILTGAVYTNAPVASNSFEVSDDWLGNYDMSF